MTRLPLIGVKQRLSKPLVGRAPLDHCIAAVREGRDRVGDTKDDRLIRTRIPLMTRLRHQPVGNVKDSVIADRAQD